MSLPHWTRFFQGGGVSQALTQAALRAQLRHWGRGFSPGAWTSKGLCTATGINSRGACPRQGPQEPPEQTLPALLPSSPRLRSHLQDPDPPWPPQAPCCGSEAQSSLEVGIATETALKPHCTSIQVAGGPQGGERAAKRPPGTWQRPSQKLVGPVLRSPFPGQATRCSSMSPGLPRPMSQQSQGGPSQQFGG